MENSVSLLKVIVGSQAHGLATPESDTDYRGVFVVPTEEILRIGGHTQQTSWIEGKDDDTSWEIGHFLMLATKCNPTILETFLAPMIRQAPERPVISPNTNDAELVRRDYLGVELRQLFPFIWNSAGVMNAFTGYGLNQRKKMLEDREGRPAKYAAAYLRTLVNAEELLKTGTFTIRIADLPIGETVLRFKQGKASHGEVIDTCREWEAKVRKAYEDNPDKQTNMEPVNEFLLKVRKQFWK